MATLPIISLADTAGTATISGVQGAMTDPPPSTQSSSFTLTVQNAGSQFQSVLLTKDGANANSFLPSSITGFAANPSTDTLSGTLMNLPTGLYNFSVTNTANLTSSIDWLVVAMSAGITCSSCTAAGGLAPSEATWDPDANAFDATIGIQFQSSLPIDEAYGFNNASSSTVTQLAPILDPSLDYTDFPGLVAAVSAGAGTEASFTVGALDDDGNGVKTQFTTSLNVHSSGILQATEDDGSYTMFIATEPISVSGPASAQTSYLDGIYFNGAYIDPAFGVTNGNPNPIMPAAAWDGSSTGPGTIGLSQTVADFTATLMNGDSLDELDPACILFSGSVVLTTSGFDTSAITAANEACELSGQYTAIEVDYDQDDQSVFLPANCITAGSGDTCLSGKIFSPVVSTSDPVTFTFYYDAASWGNPAGGPVSVPLANGLIHQGMTSAPLGYGIVAGNLATSTDQLLQANFAPVPLPPPGDGLL